MTPSPLVLNNSAPTRRMPLIMLLPLTLAQALVERFHRERL